jgi:RNase P/RNase MRP subunit POP5
LKAEGFQGQTMRDHTRLLAFELAIEPKAVETEKVLNGLIRALRDVYGLQPSVFSLNT